MLAPDYQLAIQEQPDIDVRGPADLIGIEPIDEAENEAEEEEHGDQFQGQGGQQDDRPDGQGAHQVILEEHHEGNQLVEDGQNALEGEAGGNGNEEEKDRGDDGAVEE